MLDIGWQELLLIGVITLIVVGPKDLPQVLRTGARLLAKVRAMSREFQNGLAEMAREAELDELRKKMEKAASFDPNREMRDLVDPTGKLSADFDPAEFARELKETVEGGPRTRPAAAAPSTGPVEAPPGVEAPRGSAGSGGEAPPAAGPVAAGPVAPPPATSPATSPPPPPAPASSAPLSATPASVAAEPPAEPRAGPAPPADAGAGGR